MALKFDLLIRNAHAPDGSSLSIGISEGRIAALGSHIEGTGPEYDAGGAIAGKGLHDHHLHLFATAARMRSIDLSHCRNVEAIVASLRGSPADDPWIRAVGYDEHVAGLPDRHMLDAWIPRRPLRIQDRTGAYWFLNSAGVAYLGKPPFPACVECDAAGEPNGRVWRGDAWLRCRIAADPPSLTALGARLARWGVTGVTDAGAANGPADAALLAGSIPQRLTLMGSEALPAGNGYTLGPVKLLLDECDLPALGDVAARIADARRRGRNVAAHCVTMGELVFYMAALADAGGPRPGDRIEHGGMIAESLIGDIAAAGLTVVTQPNFIHDRGDRYGMQLDASEQADLYRLGSLLRGGVKLLGGSDAPYGAPNPWIALRAATDRQTRCGMTIGASEAVDRQTALDLYQAGPLRTGAPADLILYDWPGDAGALGDVRLTLIGGVIAWQA